MNNIKLVELIQSNAIIQIILKLQLGQEEYSWLKLKIQQLKFLNIQKVNEFILLIMKI